MDIELLVKITKRAWVLPILAHMHSGVPGRQAALLTATGAGRTSFAQSLSHVIALGLLERSPGHGHPMRPEFRLTALGQTVAAQAAAVQETVVVPDHHALMRKNWTIPILAITRVPTRFSHIRAALPGLTDRALSQSLERLETSAWMARDVDRTERQLRPVYQAVDTGRHIAEVFAS